MKSFFIILLILFYPFVVFSEYVGTETCKKCHPKQYENFIKYSRMSRSFEAVEKMKNKITPEELKSCYYCHTTGYGKAGGFVSIEKTPYLKNTGCEVCHGPGKKHVETIDKKYIKRKFTLQVCEPCHTEERIKAFRFKPLLYGGAH
ncbi:MULTISPECIES: cytochrome c family protein [Thermodesulfovibrio]|uniref:Cytochrome c family protein n=2 Tax=Thermodesulfovibrio yellowstonii TaxID=28262 RepID=B5YFV2_THEYD|nr:MULTISPECIES: cytochrome c family protein [Thermodesulfovibrio]ACI20350.1 cytochrome c family protein [Thermodesulfovibrio yellowstonii DSM 11347]GLI53259.1 cytochrome c [Thermodesulfovibrio islandicus]